MKKTLLLGLMLLGGLTAKAQQGGLPDGTTAPDFTVTDINGTTHDLSDYLAEGKTVLLYISATWCGPCWQFHNSHILSDFHNAFGPNGSDQMVVLYVEGDPNTPSQNLDGVNVNGQTGRPTQGNWKEGTPYPIVESAEIAQLYDIDFFPTIYRICPETGTTTQIQRENNMTFATMLEDVNNGCQQHVGVENYAVLKSRDFRLCEAPIGVPVAITNLGSNTITSANITLLKNGTEVATQTFELDVDAAITDEVLFEGLTFDAEADYTAEINTINGVAPYEGSTEEVLATEFNVVVGTVETANNITITVHTDDFAEEMLFGIFDGDGQLVFAEEGLTEDDSNQTLVYNLVLGEGTEVDCFSVVLMDTFGDGWTLSDGEHGITIESGDQIIFENDGNIGYMYDYAAAFQTNGTLGSEKFETSTFAVYPNPTSGILNFTTEEAVDVTVMDITGKVVYTANGINNGGSINLEKLHTGVYIAKIKGQASEKIEKIIIK